jgi:hypothetical protein
MAKIETKRELVPVDKIAQLFRISEREVQRLVIYHGMPRVSRGEYDLQECMLWYVHFLHAKVCGCAGPCEGFEPDTRNAVNARAERKKALDQIASELAPELVGLKAGAIEKLLSKAIADVYEGR